MRAKFPKYIKHHWRKVKILMKPKLEDKDTIYFARYFNGKEEIHISTNYSECQQRESLLHEITHMLSESLGWELEEGQVQAMSEGYFSLFDQNPGLAKRIFKE